MRGAMRCAGIGLACLALAPAANGCRCRRRRRGLGRRSRPRALCRARRLCGLRPAIPGQRNDPLACERSDRNFPTVVAETLDVAAFRDVTCASAIVAHMHEPQVNPNNIPGTNPPQLDALYRKTTLVTVGPIGANDFNLVGVGISCINPAPPPAGTSCKETYTADGSDPNVAAIKKLRPQFDRMLREINQRAPRADVFVVGYGHYFPPGGCWPWVPVWPRGRRLHPGSRQPDRRLASRRGAPPWRDLRQPARPRGASRTRCAHSPASSGSPNSPTR